MSDVARIGVMALSSLAHASAAPGLLSVGTLVGLGLGYFIGRMHAMWVRARKDYVTTKTTVSRMRTTKWTAWWSLAKWVALAAATLWLVVVGLQLGG
jgi:hypothetical protein